MPYKRPFLRQKGIAKAKTAKKGLFILSALSAIFSRLDILP